MHPAVYEWFQSNMVSMAGGDIPFFETVNIMLQQKDLPDLWLTMSNDTGAGMQRLTIGNPAIYREFGTVTAIFVGKSGKGLTPSLLAGQRFVDMVRGDDGGPGFYQTTLTEASGKQGTLRIENVGSPDPEDFENGNWFLCSVVCAYTYDSYRGAA